MGGSEGGEGRGEEGEEERRRRGGAEGPRVELDLLHMFYSEGRKSKRPCYLEIFSQGVELINISISRALPNVHHPNEVPFYHVDVYTLT